MRVIFAAPKKSATRGAKILFCRGTYFARHSFVRDSNFFCRKKCRTLTHIRYDFCYALQIQCLR